MTHSSDLSPTEANRQRCMRYLLGELSDQDAVSFENELADSPELSNLLIEQSELLCCIADTSPVAVPTATPNSTQPVLRIAQIAAALAACFLVAIIGWKLNVSDQPKSAEEDLLIAQAWAATEAPAVGLQSLDVDIENENAGSLDEIADESSLSWVMVAADEGAIIDG